MFQDSNKPTDSGTNNENTPDKSMEEEQTQEGIYRFDPELSDGQVGQSAQPQIRLLLRAFTVFSFACITISAASSENLLFAYVKTRHRSSGS